MITKFEMIDSFVDGVLMKFWLLSIKSNANVIDFLILSSTSKKNFVGKRILYLGNRSKCKHQPDYFDYG